MDLRISSRQRAAGPAVRTEGKKQASAASAQPRTDRFTLSRRIAEQLEAQNRLLMGLTRPEKKKPALWELDEAENENPELKAMTESMKTMQRCQKIAARIMRGDKVPPEDERYLMENDPDGYKLAMAMRTPKRNPKKWESVLKEEDKTSESQSTGEDAAACGEVCEASSSGESGGAPEGAE